MRLLGYSDVLRTTCPDWIIIVSVISNDHEVEGSDVEVPSIG